MSVSRALAPDDLAALADSVDGFVRRGGAAREPGAAWGELAALGWPGVGVPETQGGLGGGVTATAVLMRGLGRSLSSAPLLATAACAGLLCTADGQTARLARIAEGGLWLALAYLEPGGGQDETWVNAVAHPRAGGGWRLSGAKRFVLDGAAAHEILISACIGAPDGELALFVLSAEAPGLTRRRYAAADGRAVCDVDLDAVEVPGEARLALSDTRAALSRAVSEAAVLVAHDSCGVMDLLADLTVEHLKTRRQFGGPLARFQVLQHRAVDMEVALREAGALASAAAYALDDRNPQAMRLASAAKVATDRAAHLLGGQAIQLHGGVGVTEEYAVGPAFRRLLLNTSLFGDVEHHLQRLAAP